MKPAEVLTLAPAVNPEAQSSLFSSVEAAPRLVHKTCGQRAVIERPHSWLKDANEYYCEQCRVIIHPAAVEQFVDFTE